MRHFYDIATGMQKHAISSAAIIDSKGEYAGKVIVRYTAGTIGWNHEVGVLFSAADMDLNTTAKGDSYSNPAALYDLLNDAGAKCFDWLGKRLGSWGSKHSYQIDVGSLSGFNNIRTIKLGNKKYTLIWVM
jgi:hypothetical protein